jgi:CheY-like chemotaxis protein
MLRKRPVTDRKRYEHGLDIIERSAQAQARLVEDVLDMSRISANKLKVEVQSVDFGSLVRSSVEQVRVKAAAKGLQMECNASTPALVVGDPERLRQVLQKVIGNAFRFTPPGGHVWVDLDVKDGCAFVRVRDDGRGIAGDQLPRVFEPFYSTNDSPLRRSRGLGLGLAIARYIVQEHRGMLRIESPGPGRGTTVTIELPIAQPTAGVLAVSEPGGEERRVAPLARIRVLVVDDDTDARRTLTEMLMAEGADVRPTPSARAALDELRDFQPHVIVTDITMPDGDSLKFIREVRALPPPLATVPALALTAHARPGDAAAAAAAGYQRQLSKPPEPKALTEAIAQLGSGAS